MTKKLLTIICMAVMLTACGNADSSTAVTTPAGQTTTTTTTTTEATETESKTSSQTSEDEDETVTSETTTTAQTEEPTITTTTPEEITTTTTTAETTKPKVTTTTKKSTTTKKQTTTTKVTTTKPKTTTTTAKKTTTTTTTTTKKVEQPPEGRVMYCYESGMSKKATNSATYFVEFDKGTKVTVIETLSNNYGDWAYVYYNGSYGYVSENALTSLPSSRWDEELCNLINDYRESLGLEKLKIDQRLMEAAQIRLDEQKVSAGHTRPDGSSCFTVFDEVGISDESLGVENLGGGATPQAIFEGWKNSSGHNRNMTYANSVAMGVAFDIERGSWVFLARTAESDE